MIILLTAQSARLISEKLGSKTYYYIETISDRGDWTRWSGTYVRDEKLLEFLGFYHDHRRPSGKLLLETEVKTEIMKAKRRLQKMGERFFQRMLKIGGQLSNNNEEVLV